MPSADDIETAVTALVKGLTEFRQVDEAVGVLHAYGVFLEKQEGD